MICIPRYRGIERTPSGILVPARYWRNHAAQLAHGHGHGADMGGPPWNPAQYPGTLLWAGAYQEARATRNTAPNLLDAACEDKTKWTAVGAGVTVSNEAGGVSGNCMRVTGGGAALSNAKQDVLVTGNRYAASGWYRGDGTTGSPRLYGGGSSVFGSGTTSNTWQAVANELTAAGSNFACANVPTTGYSEFDSFTLTQLSLNSYLPLVGTALSQSTDTAKPWVSSDGLGWRFQGGDLFSGGVSAALAKCLHDGTGGMAMWAFRPSVLNASNRMLATAGLATTNVGVLVSYSNANTARVYIMNGGGAYDYDSGATACTVAINTWYVATLCVASGAGGVTLDVNGANKITGALTAPSGANATSALMLGAEVAGSASGVDGIVSVPWVTQGIPDAATRAQGERYLYQQASGAPAPW